MSIATNPVLHAKAQVAAVPSVDPVLCQRCRECAARAVCKSKALVRIDLDEPPSVDSSRCYGCKACFAACPCGAVR